MVATLLGVRPRSDPVFDQCSTPWAVMEDVLKVFKEGG